MTGLLYESLAALRVDRAAWRLAGDRLRILCYHGICRDDVANEPWVPSYFVTQSAFEQQLAYLRRDASVLPLSEAVSRLKSGSLPKRAVALTFDDGYANNLYLAAPILRKYGMTATVFLSTRYIESDEWYPFLQLKLLRLFNPDVRLPDYKTAPIDEVLGAAAPLWRETAARLTDAQRETLRPLTCDEVQAAVERGLEFGAHSHSHCIARNEREERRREEVAVSVRKVAEWTGRRVRLFSYPNGERGDFGDIEKRALREAGVEAAVTGVSGANTSRTDLLELKRYPLTVFHDGARFRAEASGVRSVLMSMLPTRFQ